MNKLTRVFDWILDNGLLVFAAFLLVFIPAYPKIPLADIIPGYLVRLRLEDLFVAVAASLWGAAWLRNRISWKTPLTFWVIAYAAAGLLSVISGVLITATIPAESLHIGKSLLHFFRYLEYFSLFFIAYSSIKSSKDIKLLLAVVFGTVAFVSAYGIGQKYFYWPVYSTMNREFSKGMRLILTEHARVPATFGGHYDFAAYLVITMPLLLTFFFTTKQKTLKYLLGVILLLATWGIVTSGSRISYGGYIVAAGLVFLFLAWKKKSWIDFLQWGTTRGIVFVVINAYLMLTFGQDLYVRFLNVLDSYPSVSQVYHTINGIRKKVIYEHIPIAFGLKELPKVAVLHVEKPKNAITIDEALAQLEGTPLNPSDTQPVPSDRPDDVHVDVPDQVYVASVASDGSLTMVLEERPRTWSKNAQDYDLSQAIRYDTLWPRAISGFKRNPLFGSGYATLTKESTQQFTEAESTDNNFLRTLGETGLFGFITFYGAVIVGLYYAARLLQREWASEDTVFLSLAIGYIAASIGLIVNATYIDVYAASKVAFTFWGLTGIVIAAYTIPQKMTQKSTSTEQTLSFASALKRNQKKLSKKK